MTGGTLYNWKRISNYYKAFYLAVIANKFECTCNTPTNRFFPQQRSQNIVYFTMSNTLFFFLNRFLVICNCFDKIIMYHHFFFIIRHFIFYIVFLKNLKPINNHLIVPFNLFLRVNKIFDKNISCRYFDEFTQR